LNLTQDQIVDYINFRYIIIALELLIKLTFGKHKQVRQVKHPYSDFRREITQVKRWCTCLKCIVYWL